MTTRIAVTGTPGVGKTTATEELDLPVCHLNDAIRAAELFTERDQNRDSLVADLAAVERYVDDWVTERSADVVVIESHLAHHLSADRVVLLRCRPDLLADRLRDRGESEASVAENGESEALDVIAGEAIDEHGRDAVYEIDSTDRDPTETADAIRAVIDGDREPAVGTVDFLRFLHD